MEQGCHADALACVTPSKKKTPHPFLEAILMRRGRPGWGRRNQVLEYLFQHYVTTKITFDLGFGIK